MYKLYKSQKKNVEYQKQVATYVQNDTIFIQFENTQINTPL